MNNFKNYAEYYNLLYADKNYKEEVSYVENLIHKYSEKKVKSILDLGCGTGKHDLLFAEKGYEITGIDLSEQMINIAKQNKHKNTEYFVGDVRNIKLNKKFDTVVSLFHGASYQNKNLDFENYLKTAYNQELKFIIKIIK